MSPTQIVDVVVLGVCILASGFFSGSETALVAVPRERIPQLRASRKGRQLEELVTDLERTLSTLLVANNFVNILAAAVATTLFIDLLGEDWGPWAATGTVTAIILVVGEITPKSLAARYPERFSLVVAPSIYRLGKLLSPISRVFLGATRGIFRVLRVVENDSNGRVTEDDIRAMATLGEEEGAIDPAEREIIDALFRLEDRPVREVMTPRIEIVSLTTPVHLKQVRDLVAETGHSRFPVVGRDLDDVVGVLYMKDLVHLEGDPGPDTVMQAIRKPLIVPESKPILPLLHEMRLRHTAFAIITDEHGSVDGVVTIKDLVSELVGDIQDEHDRDMPRLLPLGRGMYIADGRLPVDDLEDIVPIPDSGDFTSVAGWFLHLAGRVPKAGDTVEDDDDGIRMTVLQMDRHRIDRVRIETDTR